MISPVEKGKVSAGILDKTIAAVALAMVLYHMISPFYLLAVPLKHQNIHLAFGLALVFLSQLRIAKRGRPLVLAFLVLSVVTTGYVHFNFDWLEINTGDPFPPVAVLVFGALIMVLTIEACRRAYGIIMPTVIVLFIVYGALAHLIPGYFQAFYVSPSAMIARLGIGSLGISGVYGIFLSISANSVFLFVIFGALLQATGATHFFIQVGRLVAGKMVGGPAMTAVVTSCLVGMVTGSVAANIATTGSFTIPLMKKTGYTPEQAGAVEATASTGGQIMPPIMGAAAFLMAGIIGVPYLTIMTVAIIPAILYYLSIAIYVRLWGLKLRLSSAEEDYDVREMILNAPLFLIPLAFLIVLLVQRHSLPFTMSWSILVLLALSSVRKSTRPSLRRLVEAFTDGAITGSQIAVTTAALGIVGGIIAWRGLGIKLPELIVSLAGGDLTLTLLLVMVASLILGMGVPTTAAYLLVVMTTAPAMMKLGVTMLQAHFFAFYYAIFSMITPPVAIGAVIASKLAGGQFNKTALEATKIGAGGLIVPFLFTWQPLLLLLPVEDPFWAAIGMVGSVILIVALQIVICNHYITSLNGIERAVFAAIVVAIFLSLPWHSYSLLVGGIAVFAAATIVQSQKRRTLRPANQALL